MITAAPARVANALRGKLATREPAAPHRSGRPASASSEVHRPPRVYPGALLARPPWLFSFLSNLAPGHRRARYSSRGAGPGAARLDAIARNPRSGLDEMSWRSTATTCAHAASPARWPGRRSRDLDDSAGPPRPPSAEERARRTPRRAQLGARHSRARYAGDLRSSVELRAGDSAARAAVRRISDSTTFIASSVLEAHRPRHACDSSPPQGGALRTCWVPVWRRVDIRAEAFVRPGVSIAEHRRSPAGRSAPAPPSPRCAGLAHGGAPTEGPLRRHPRDLGRRAATRAITSRTSWSTPRGLRGAVSGHRRDHLIVAALGRARGAPPRGAALDLDVLVEVHGGQLGVAPRSSPRRQRGLRRRRRAHLRAARRVPTSKTVVSESAPRPR